MSEIAVNNVLRLVRSQCKQYGIKFKVVDFDEDNNMGCFDYSIRTLIVAKRYKTNRRLRKNKKLSSSEFALTALHELIHVWQWKRNCPNFKLAVKDNGAVLVDYALGLTWYSKKQLLSILKPHILIEWEAEHMSMQIARSMGVDFLEKRYIRNAKIYLYAWLVLVETGIWVSPLITRKWSKYIDTTDRLDFTKELISKLISITIKNKHLARYQWIGKNYTKLIRSSTCVGKQKNK